MDFLLSTSSRACAVALILAVAACGGGGGGGPAQAPPPQQLQLSATQLSFGAPSTGGLPPPLELAGTVSGSPQEVYAFVEITTAGIDGYTPLQITDDSVTTFILLKPPFTLQPGTYRDTITVRACPNAACTRQFAGSPATVNVTYSVGLEVSPASLAAQAVEGAAPPAQNIDLRYYAGDGSWLTSIAYASGSAWLTVPGSGSGLPTTLAAGFVAQPPGSYAATLNITATGAVAQTRAVPVSYVVQPLLQVPAVPSFSVTNQQGAAGQTRSIAITTGDPARNTAWSATVDADADWVELTTASGNTGGASTLALTLVAAEVEKLRNGRYLTTIPVDPAIGGVSTIDLPVTLDLDRTHVATVASYVAADNREADVIIRGARFDEVTIANVRFGAIDAVSFNVDSATRIRARHPALPAGRYPVTIVVAGAAIASTAELVVQAPFSYAAAGTVISPVPFSNVAEFDPERRACYVASTFDPSPARIGAAFATTGWSTIVSPGGYGPFIRGMALTADGRELLIALNEEVVHLDPATLVETRRTRLDGASVPNDTIAGLARVDDGTIAAGLPGDIRAYRPWDRTQGRLLEIQFVGSIAANGTGNKLLWVSQTVGTSYIVIDSGDLATSFQYSGAGHLLDYTADRFGTRWAFTKLSNSNGTEITDGQGSVIEQIPGAAQSNAMSADGNTLVLGLASEYRFFDLTPLSGGGDAIDLGPVPVAEASSLYNMHFTPHQDEVVSCGRGRIQAAAVP